MYELNSWIASNNILRYNQNYVEGLQLPSMLNDSQNYYAVIKVFPQNTLTFVAASPVKQDTIQIEPYSYLLGIGGYSQQPEGFSFTLLDKGNNLYLSPNRNIYPGIATSGIASNNLNTTNYPINPVDWLTSPIVISPPGQIQVNMTNLSSADNICQLVLYFASPITKSFMMTQSIKGSE